MISVDVDQHVPSTIERGVLSLRTADAISRFLEGDNLAQDDRAVLARAASFLQLIVAGASLVSQRPAMQGFSANESIDALGQALTPFNVLADIVKDSDVVDFFKTLQGSVAGLSAGDPDAPRQPLESACRFFRALDQSIRTGLGADLMPLSSQLDRPPMFAFA